MKRVIITLGDGGENIEPKISEVEDGWWDSLDPKSSEVNEEEVPFWFFPSILSLKKKKENHSIEINTSTQSKSLFILQNTPKLLAEKGLKMRRTQLPFLLGNKQTKLKEGKKGET